MRAQEGADVGGGGEELVVVVVVELELVEVLEDVDSEIRLRPQDSNLFLQRKMMQKNHLRLHLIWTKYYSKQVYFSIMQNCL